MPDHVHVLATPLEKRPGAWFSLSEILQSVKGNTARQINHRRSASGPIWQRESFDRIIRNDQEFAEKCDYVFGNAVKAGLVGEGADYDGLWWEEEWSTAAG